MLVYSYKQLSRNVFQPKWAVVIEDIISTYTKKHYSAIILLNTF